MKRTEMLKLMNDKAEDLHQGLGGLLSPAIYNSSILAFLEEKGMRPPILFNQKYKGPLEGWESESDKKYQHSPKCPQLCINEKCEIKDEEK